MKEMEKLAVIEAVIRKHPCRDQVDILERLAANGCESTQSTVSRALKKLGAVKVEGVYQLPELRAPGLKGLEILETRFAGPNLIVMKTGPGNASRIALIID